MSWAKTKNKNSKVYKRRMYELGKRRAEHGWAHETPEEMSSPDYQRGKRDGQKEAAMGGDNSSQ